MRVVLLGCFVVALLLAAAGCGGDDTQSASEQWADSVCTSMDDWATQMQQHAEDVQEAITSPSADSVATIQAAIAQGADATQDLVSTLEALEPPPTSDGQSARSLLDSFTTELEQTANEVQDETESLQSGSSATELATAIGTIATEVSSAVAKAQSTFASLQELEGELRDAFAREDSCQQLDEDFG
jgi:gas vesicle protein